MREYPEDRGGCVCECAYVCTNQWRYTPGQRTHNTNGLDTERDEHQVNYRMGTQKTMGGPHSDNRCGIMPGTFQVYQEGNYKEPYYYKKGRF